MDQWSPLRSELESNPSRPAPRRYALADYGIRPCWDSALDLAWWPSSRAVKEEKLTRALCKKAVFAAMFRCVKWMVRCKIESFVLASQFAR